ncbi:hypothetical protein CLIB1444_21S00804 [[Candida] jaroonii]|uniref:Uncharacterized protein n=1 Tax=[Candida] jaroonii TaxID=467808 RepID=A0ACA9YG08_9ASCO|nr:hypothetical protein CLIB1444_21S00804 [[Candida] jaroonii]
MKDKIDKTVEEIGDGQVDQSIKDDMKIELKRSLFKVSNEDMKKDDVKNNLDKIKESSITEIPVILTVDDTNFLLIQNDDISDDLTRLVALYDSNILDYDIVKLFNLIRTDDDLIELHNLTDREEMVLKIPALDIVITEDNIYARDIKVSDFLVIFKGLKLGGNLKFIIDRKERFITRFNDLHDEIRSNIESKKRKLQ